MLNNTISDLKMGGNKKQVLVYQPILLLILLLAGTCSYAHPPSYTLGYNVEWTDLVNVTVAADNSLNKTGTSLAWDAGSGSYNLLPANTDGSMEFVVNTLGDAFTYGFSSSSIGIGNYARLNYAIQILANNDIQIFEGATQIGTTYGKVLEADVFRISREGSTIKYYRNGVVLRTSTNATNVPLQVGSSISKTHAPVVTSSFAPELKVTAAIAAGLTTGGITLSVQGGIAPYTYSWNSGETTSSISNKVRGTYIVTVADAAGATSTRTYSLGYKTEWTDLVNVTVAADNSLNKTGTVLAWDAGSGSYNLLSANTDGSMEFVVNTLGDIFTYGFSSSNIGTGNYGRLNYAIQILANNDIQIFEGTTQIGSSYGKVREGDVFRISREGSTIKYYRNGVLLRTTPNATNVPLQMGSSIAKTHAPVVTSSFAPELKVTATIAAGLTTGGITLSVQGGIAPYTYSWNSGETTSSISNKVRGTYTVTVADAAGATSTRTYSLGYKTEWTDLVNVTVAADNSLNKTGTVLAWDAGSGSYNLLPANTDGSMEFVVNILGDAFTYGFSSSSIGTGNYGRLNYAIQILANNDIQIFEGTTQIGSSYGKVREGDVFRISREGSTVKYYCNGVVLRTTPNATNVRLQVGSSIYKTHAPVVTSSFAPELKVTATIAAGLTTGGITLSVQGGIAPYTYSWNSGETTSSISNKVRGTYTVTVADAAGATSTRTYSLGYKTEWTDLVNVTVAADNSLNKTGTALAWDAGSGSYNLLSANTDGSMEFVVNTLGDVFMYGLSSSNIGTGSYGRLNYTIHISATNDIHILEGSTPINIYGKVREGDVFRISREGSTIKYYRNGVVLRTSTNATNVPLQVGSSILATHAPVVTTSFAPELKVTATIAAGLTTGGITLSVQGGIAPYTYSWNSGETTSSISNKVRGTYTVTIADAAGATSTRTYSLGYKTEWTDLVNVTVAADNSLNKTGTALAWDAGSGSYNLLSANTDGSMEFVVNTLGDVFMYGLTPYNVPVGTGNYQRLSYSIHVTAANDIGIYEGNTSIGLFGKVRQGDVFRISREGSTIKYYRNGVILRTTTNATNIPLQVGSSILTTHAPVVTSSFAPELKVTAAIAAGLTTGGITLSVQGGIAPYTYSWSSGETTSSISNKVRGTYTVTVADAAGATSTRTYSLGYKTEWTDLVNVTVAADNSLNKTVTSPAWDAGSGSYNLLPANTDGSMEFVVNTLGDVFMYGLTPFNVPVGTGNYQRLSYSIYITDANDIAIFEGSTWIGSFGKVRQGDVFRISREGSTIKFYRNGVVLRTTTNATNVPLQVGSSILTTHAPVVTSSFAPELKVTAAIVTGLTTGAITLSVQGGTAPYTYSWNSGETTSSISNKVQGAYTITVTDAEGTNTVRSYNLGYKTEWTDIVNVTVATDNSLNKTGTSLAWDAGSGSYNLLPANTDGWMEFVVNTLGDAFMYGFSSSSIGTGNYPRLNYAIFISANNDVQAYESGVSVGIYSKVREGDVFRISREGSTIKYYRNGVVLRTTTNATNVPLQVGSTISKTHAPVVTSSFAPELKVTATIAAGLTTGGITLSVQGGIAPYTYSWNSGETTPSISNKVRGTYIVTVADAAGATSTRTYSLGYKTEWTNLVNITVAADNSLNKTGTSLAWDAGSGTSNILQANADGWLEFVVNSLGDVFMYGLTPFNVPVGTGTYQRLSYSIYITAANDIGIFEGSTSIGLFGKVRQGDVFRISREGGSIRYYQNGVLLRTAANAISSALQVGSSISRTHAPIVTASFWKTLIYPLTWTNLENVSLNPDGSLTRLPGTSWWAGASSLNVLPGNSDGYLEFQMGDLNTQQMIGLSDFDANSYYATIDFAIYFSENTFSTSISGVITSFGPFTKGDIFRIAREGTAIVFYRNGVAFSSSSVNVNVPLMADVSIYNASAKTPVVSLSFEKQIRMTPVFNFPDQNNTNGSVALSVEGTYTPAVVSWLPSQESGYLITGKSRGSYTATVTDAASRTYTRTYRLGYPITWTDLQNMKVNADNTLTQTVGQGVWTAGAISGNSLAPNTDGWIEFVIPRSGVSAMIGLSTMNAVTSIASMDYVFNIGSGNVLSIYERGSNRGLFGYLQQGDVVAISREGSNIKYYLNGAVLRTVATTPAYVLYADVSTSTNVGPTPLITSSFGRSPQTFYCIADGNWTTPSTWSLTEGGSAAGLYPVSGDIVHIKGFSVIINTGVSVTDVHVTITNNTTLLKIDTALGMLDVKGHIYLQGISNTATTTALQVRNEARLTIQSP